MLPFLMVMEAPYSNLFSIICIERFMDDTAHCLQNNNVLYRMSDNKKINASKNNRLKAIMGIFIMIEALV